jgi:hypothetical protein
MLSQKLPKGVFMRDIQRKSSTEGRAGITQRRWFMSHLLLAILLLAAIACNRATAQGDAPQQQASETVHAVPMDRPGMSRAPIVNRATNPCATCPREAPAAPESLRDEVRQGSIVESEQQQALLRVAVFLDQSESMTQARVPQVSAESLVPLLERLKIDGGEVAVGLIRDRSDAPLTRVFVPAPPSPPVFPARASANIFEKAQQRKREEAERARYEERLGEWQADVAARINAFAESVTPVFSAAADAPATDIHAALLRADVFVSEPNVFGRPARNVVILHTDGVETVNSKIPAQFSAPAELLVVNGTGTVGHLEALQPLRFEALDAAIRYVVDGGSNVRR